MAKLTILLELQYKTHAKNAQNTLSFSKKRRGGGDLVFIVRVKGKRWTGMIFQALTGNFWLRARRHIL